ncbi:uncharacterized protein PV09_05779 [Verruconis gallopava]|uniref:Major facilitator superfamily (MFS) profile domain-containing protein n=1 Tax=Verruconis gallopava TaxID=253628 RepID=A0A0D1YRB8_9PEZI|nr:uncharacterized protein PV09_05779 [Verruconis gallopava]KIW03137.1 hypothetical protein PV09_05779 [Verruconis gallopava]
MFNVDLKTYKWAIIFCSMSAIGALVYGYDNSYYNGVLAMQPFKDHYGDHYVDGKKALAVSFTSLTASSIYIGDLLGALISAPINDRWGRKAVFIFGSLCILGGGVAQVADNHHEGVIVLGRILIGFGVGSFAVTSLLYMGEIAPLAVRGPALMMFQFLQSCSQLIASGITQGTETINGTLSYKIPMGGLVVLPVIMFMCLPILPESPVWYILKGRRDDAVKSFRKIHKSEPHYDPTSEIQMLEEAKRVQEEENAKSSWVSLLTNPIERKKIVFSAGAMFAQQINGILFFYVYGVVFAQAIGIKQPFTIQLITNVLQIVAVGASVVTGNKVRRRLNYLITTVMMFVAFLVMGGIGTHKALSTADQYVIVVFSYVIIVAFNFGMGPLAFTVAREMAVGVNQDKIMSIAIAVWYFTIWLVSFTAPYLYDTAGLGPMLGFVYAGTTCISFAWAYFCVGETTGRTTLEISMFFDRGIPARHWRKHVFPPHLAQSEDFSADEALKSGTVATSEKLT